MLELEGETDVVGFHLRICPTLLMGVLGVNLRYTRNGKEVLCAGIDAELLDTDAVEQSGGEGISDFDILQAQVLGVIEVSVHTADVGGGIIVYRVVETREAGTGVFGSPAVGNPHLRKSTLVKVRLDDTAL